MKHAVENQDRLDVIQAEIVDIRASDGAVESVVTALGALYHARAVILYRYLFTWAYFCWRVYSAKRA